MGVEPVWVMDESRVALHFCGVATPRRHSLFRVPLCHIFCGTTRCFFARVESGSSRVSSSRSSSRGRAPRPSTTYQAPPSPQASMASCATPSARFPSRRETRSTRTRTRASLLAMIRPPRQPSTAPPFRTLAAAIEASSRLPPRSRTSWPMRRRVLLQRRTDGC